MATVPLRIDILTIFPRMLDGILGESMIKRAQAAGLVQIRCVNLRDYATGVHLSTDDRPYGGGPGMVMTPEPVFRAVEALRGPDTQVLLMTPQGTPFKQAVALDLSRQSHLLILCGHYEGVDERIREALVDREISIGDYVLTNGVIAAAVVSDAVVRLLPGALGGAGAADDESFTTGRLEYPQYTRPPVFRGMSVPEILLSGNHGEIAKWRLQQSMARTQARRPDLGG
ncbi:MAG: tRNA (guanosine(37)-N1)-methyltransferase TrmD [Kiritimatiellae bacterium]|nr:tRNA (guanosine(37)-N1)-methyltransferase TrmD [Kiritimatiellia bacterium]MDD4341455.1 tRNA (guanosine(37)-N1)-methyltransferase TrmD [Kiritimatiellia bacterium]